MLDIAIIGGGPAGLTAGLYAVRGGILDVFSPGSAYPCRVDFFGDEIDLLGLLLDRHIFMNDADAALARDGDRHTRLGDRIHCRRNERDIQTNRSRKIRRQVDIRGQHRAFRGDEEYVVVSKTFLTELFFKIHTHSKLCPFLIPGVENAVFCVQKMVSTQ